MSDLLRQPALAPAAGRTALPPVRRPVRPLPVWPLGLMFGLVPLWWALGGFALGWPLFGVLLLSLLVARGRIALPTGTACWLLFLAVVLLSAVRIDRLTGFLTFGLRFGFLLTALVTGLYGYNLARQGTAWHRLLRPLGLFWLAVVALGWLAVLAPTFSITTAVERLMPATIVTNGFVQDLTHVHANEFNALSAHPIFRPAAPFPFTNNWGTAYALLLPCVLAYLSSVRTGRFRMVLIASLPLSVVPAFATLNRGMFLALGVGLLYLALRALVRGEVRQIASVGVVVALFWLVSLVVPVQDKIADRVNTTDTNVDRLDLYVQTWHAVLRSPLLGYGVPNTADTTLAAEPLGTQGLLWQLMYCHGLPALAIFLCWGLLVTRRLAQARSSAGRWLSTVPVIALTVIPVYGYIDQNLSVIFLATGIGLAAVQGPVNRTPTAARRGVR